MTDRTGQDQPERSSDDDRNGEIILTPLTGDDWEEEFNAKVNGLLHQTCDRIAAFAEAEIDGGGEIDVFAALIAVFRERALKLGYDDPDDALREFAGVPRSK